jgi:hypothetical protein
MDQVAIWRRIYAETSDAREIVWKLDDLIYTEDAVS